MNLKVKIMRTSEEISEEEIEKYKDFNSILSRHKASSSRQKTTRMILETAFLIILSTYIAIRISSPPILKNEELSKHSSSIKIEKKTRNDETTTLIVEKKTNKKKTEKSTQKPSLGYIEAAPPSGYEDLLKYFDQNLKYPQSSKENGIEGTVMVEFYIDEKGDADEINIIKSIEPEIDKEAQRLINEMPLWKPASFDGRAISTKIVLPLEFKLEKKP